MYAERGWAAGASSPLKLTLCLGHIQGLAFGLAKPWLSRRCCADPERGTGRADVVDLDPRGPGWIVLDIVLRAPSAADLSWSLSAALCNNNLLPMSNVDLYSAIGEVCVGI